MLKMNTTNRYDKYKDSGIEWIGEIPESWKLVKTGRIFRNIKEIVGEKSMLVERFALTLNGVIKRSKSDAEGLQPEQFNGYQYIRKNQLVFKLIDLKNVNTSRVGLCEFEEGMVSPAYIVLCNNNLNNRYYYYYFISLWHNEIFNHLGGDGVRSALNVKDLLAIPTFDISIKEQEAIAGCLDRKCGAIDETIEKQKSVIEKLKEYKQSIITQAVTKGLDKSAPMKDSGIEWIGQIPQHWEISKIKFSAIVNPKYNENLSSDTLVSFAPMECLTNCSLECKDTILGNVLGSYTYFANNDIIMAKVTPCFENGNIALATNLNNGVGFGSSELYVFRSVNIFNKFLLYLLQNTQFKDKAIATMYGTGGLKRVSIEFVKNYKFACPDLKEQEQIAEFLDKKCSEIDKTIEDKEKLIEKLVEYKKSLIYECVTGKRRVI